MWRSDTSGCFFLLGQNHVKRYRFFRTFHGTHAQASTYTFTVLSGTLMHIHTRTGTLTQRVTNVQQAVFLTLFLMLFPTCSQTPHPNPLQLIIHSPLAFPPSALSSHHHRPSGLPSPLHHDTPPSLLLSPTIHDRITPVLVFTWIIYVPHHPYTAHISFLTTKQRKHNSS